MCNKSAINVQYMYYCPHLFFFCVFIAPFMRLLRLYCGIVSSPPSNTNFLQNIFIHQRTKSNATVNICKGTNYFEIFVPPVGFKFHVLGFHYFLTFASCSGNNPLNAILSPHMPLSNTQSSYLLALRYAELTHISKASRCFVL